MIQLNFTTFPNLETECLILRQVRVEDENEFFILKSDERILEFLDTKAKTFDEARNFLRKINEGIAKNEWILWGITLKGKDKLVGTICFWNISLEESKAEIGYELMPEYQGKGIMMEAIAKVIEYGFKSMKLNSIEAITNQKNSKSIKLLERNNFIKEVSFKENDSSNEATKDEVIYTLMNKVEIHNESKC